ncbi:MAG: hypothetical protein H8D87_06405 [Deltaproteobacteria bacterium]|nr:hypothetical protein [Candidatus Desulfobacula maris]
MTLAERTTGSPGISPFYIKKKEAYGPGWKGEWERVQELRIENDLTMGGNCSVEQESGFGDFIYRSSWCKRNGRGE